jgi:UrcA family protein
MKRRNAMLKSILIAAAVAASIAPVAATAGQQDINRTVNVSDLDLSNPADRARAERRINAAVRSLCEGNGARSVAARTAEAACREQAMASVRPLGF